MDQFLLLSKFVWDYHAELGSPFLVYSGIEYMRGMMISYLLLIQYAQFLARN